MTPPSAAPGYYVSERSEMRGFLPQAYSRVLEVGCGEGAFVAQLDKSAEVWGIEPVAAAARVASASRHRVLVGIYDDVCSELPDQYFDLVICNDVIEHIPVDYLPIAFRASSVRKNMFVTRLQSDAENARTPSPVAAT